MCVCYFTYIKSGPQRTDLRWNWHMLQLCTVHTLTWCMHKTHIPLKHTHNRAQRSCTLLTEHTGTYSQQWDTNHAQADVSPTAHEYKIGWGCTQLCAQLLHRYLVQLAPYLAQVPGCSPQSYDQARQHAVTRTMEDSLQSLLLANYQLSLCTSERTTLITKTRMHRLVLTVSHPYFNNLETPTENIHSQPLLTFQDSGSSWLSAARSTG